MKCLGLLFMFQPKVSTVVCSLIEGQLPSDRYAVRFVHLYLPKGCVLTLEPQISRNARSQWLKSIYSGGDSTRDGQLLKCAGGAYQLRQTPQMR